MRFSCGAFSWQKDRSRWSKFLLKFIVAHISFIILEFFKLMFDSLSFISSVPTYAVL